MKITIQGQDFTSALDAVHPLSIERKLNAPSVCRFWLSLPSRGSLSTPARNQSVSITGDDGTLYFTGYIAAGPLPQYAGLDVEGPRYRIAIEAVSDEMLLDQISLAPAKSSANQMAGPLLASLVEHTGSSALSSASLNLNQPISSFSPQPGAPWSTSAAAVADQARSTYRALNGSLSLSSIPAAVHTLNENDGSLSLANLNLAGKGRSLANDITVCGEHEPAAYVTEYFLGDGVTTQFNLAQPAYSLPASRATLIRELFNEGAIDTRLWGNSGGSQYLSIGEAGLVMQGGNGTDGDTLLSWIDPIEMGGTLLLEATGVTLAAFSTGILAGLFTGLETQSACTAGFLASAAQGSGAVSIQFFVQGAACGSTYAINPANQYALRLRVRCAEVDRGSAVYRSWGDSGAVTFGGQWNQAAGILQFEIQETVNGVAGMPVTLYTGSISNLPGACSVVAASSINLIGTMRSLNLPNLGSGWVVSTPANGSPVIRRVGSTAQAAECHVESTGKLVFYTGFAPAVGEQIAVSYRTVARAAGRAVNTASQQSLAQSGLPSVIAFAGSVTQPSARSSLDCRNAAQAIAAAAAGLSALWAGTYKSNNLALGADVWPGEALLLNAPSAGLNAQVVVRAVTVTYESTCPDLVQFDIAFANDWANDLAIRTSAAVPTDAWLPAPASPTFATNLNALAVTAMSGSTVTINTGAIAPTDGGFEIRKRDYAFMPGEDPDLVMRGSQLNMSFTRTSASDRFYIRMFDGASPPNYSEFSAALLLNLPLGS